MLAAHELTGLLEKLRRDPRLPSFGGLTIFEGGLVQLIHRFGAVSFESVPAFLAWVDALDKAPTPAAP